jgi:ABC-type branched-subunit amino acid transport system ATPase component
MKEESQTLERSDVLDPVPLVVEGVSFRYRGVLAVNNCSLSVRAGTVTGLIGPNGAGKSTLINLISGSLHPTSGAIRLLGEETQKWPSHRVASAGFIRTFQTPAEFGSLTTLENLLVGVRGQLGERLSGAFFKRPTWQATEREHVQRAIEILDRLGIYGKRNDRAATLSGGQRRLVELGRVLMSNPRVLLLDEPMFGLSPVVSETVCQLLQDMADDGVAILLVEHLLKAVETLCHEVYVLVAGEIVASGSYRDIMAVPQVRDAYLGTLASRMNVGARPEPVSDSPAGLGHA